MVLLQGGIVYNSEGIFLIDINNVSFKYDNSIKCDNILNSIDLKVKKGEFVAVLGHNGSGKSTLAKHLNAILIPDEGKVFVENMDTCNEDYLWDIRSKISMVFQNPDNQIVATIVEDDVAFMAENLGYPSAEIRKRVDKSLEIVGMSKFKNHAPHLLSGGQKQRIAIAGVLAVSPDAIVLDEPTAMLDPVGRQEVMNAIYMLNKQYNITVILITHNMDEAVKCDRVVVINGGRIIIDNTPKKVFSDVELIKDIGLDVPQVTELAYLLNKSNVSIPVDILDVDECVEELLKICQ